MGRDRSIPGGCIKCGASTNEGKEFCLEHIGEMPYVQRVLEAERELEEDVRRILRGGRVGSGPARERVLEVVSTTEAREARSVARMAGVPYSVTCVILKHLARRGLLQLRPGRGGGGSGVVVAWVSP